MLGKGARQNGCDAYNSLMGFPELSPAEIRVAKKKGEDHTHNRCAALFKGTADNFVRVNALTHLAEFYEGSFIKNRDHFRAQKLAHHADDTPENEREYAKALFGFRAGLDLIVAIAFIEASKEDNKFDQQLSAIFKIKTDMAEYLEPYDTAPDAGVKGRDCFIPEPEPVHPR